MKRPKAADESAVQLEQLPVAAVILAPDGRVLGSNEDAAQLLGDAPQGAPALGNGRSRWLQRLRRAVESDGRGRVLLRKRCGQRRLALELNATRYGTRDLLVVLMDRSGEVAKRQQVKQSLRRSEEQLRHAQKMDAVGRLASGIAHDFNNVLTAIQGHVQFLLEDLPQDLSSREDAEEIRKAAERATELIRQLLTFARKQPSRPVSLNANNLITDLEKLLRRLIRADVTLETQYEDVPNVLIDPGQLEQVIVNLVVNARDAIGQAGTITIRTSRINLDEIYSARGLDLTPGEYVQIAVSDTGAGISLETQSKIFEPFFTTKAEGTGLGLSTVYGIVKQAGGHVSVYSEPARGTTFKVFLPVHAGRAHQPVVDETARANGRVLLVEDDDAVRSLARRTLEGKGYSVIEAADGDEALRIARADDGIDVVVTDLTMPRLNGEELAQRIRETQPGAGIVLMSGFSQASLVRDGRIPDDGHFLEKPFTPAALVDVVRAAMPQADGGRVSQERAV